MRETNNRFLLSQMSNVKCQMSRDARSGQLMILTVLTLATTLLGGTVIAGLLMVYQIRQGSDMANSGKAVFAADAGLEWALYNITCSTNPTKAGFCPIPSSTYLTFSNGTDVSVQCKNDLGVTSTTCDSTSTIAVKSIGNSSNIKRAFCLFTNCESQAF